ncbi:MAG: TRAP transporter large permease [Propionibacteriaceae bacterium]|jgi:tripartite ATP-independent transporter DctM subunit|nr:TRAP transporter large permease [Propionibacteriaceae bacterium]
MNKPLLENSPAGQESAKVGVAATLRGAAKALIGLNLGARLAASSAEVRGHRTRLLAGFIASRLLLVVAVAGIVWFGVNYATMSDALLVTIILIVGMFGLMAIGVSVSVAIGLPAALSLVIVMQDGDQGVYTAAQKMFDGIDNFSLLCIPLFVLAGVIMNQGGIAARLIDLAKAITGQVPGTLMHTNVLANMMFGAISGSSLACASAVGSVLGPTQEKDGYDMKVAAAVNVASAPSDALIPPSNTIIIYAMVSNASMGALFLAGYVPGILWGLTCMALVAVFCFRNKRLKGKPHPPIREGLRIFWRAVPSLLLVIIVIAGILTGQFTPTEGSGVAVAYALILSFIYGTIKPRDLGRILLNATRTSSVVLFLIGLSTIMSFAMTYAGLPRLIAEWVIDVTGGSKVGFLMLMMVILLIIGIPLDATPAVLIFTPIFLPIAMAEPFNIHPVHFGIFLVFNMGIAVITPPSAPVLFVGARVVGLKVEQVIRPLMPYFLALIGCLILVQFVPELTMWLPQAFGMVDDWAALQAATPPLGIGSWVIVIAAIAACFAGATAMILRDRKKAMSEFGPLEARVGTTP